MLSKEMTLSEEKVSIFLLLDYINNCQATRKLYLQACEALSDYNDLDLVIKLVSEEQVPFGGLCQYGLGEIWLNEKMNFKEALSTLILELANMIYAKFFSDLSFSAVDHKISQEDFVKEMEELEYKSVLLHTTTLQQAAEEQGAEWLQLDCYKFANDKKLYLSLQNQNGHMDYFRRWWQENV